MITPNNTRNYTPSNTMTTLTVTWMTLKHTRHDMIWSEGSAKRLTNRHSTPCILLSRRAPNGRAGANQEPERETQTQTQMSEAAQAAQH
jgi:hypothetical protein